MKLLLLPTVLTLFFLTSCNSNERMVKKFIKRINAREINSASKYLWPEDHASLYVFNERFLADDKLTTFDIKEVNENGTTITAKIDLLNAKEGLKAYFDSLGMLNGNTLNLTFSTRKTEEADYISIQFPWDDCGLPAKLKRSSVQTEALNLRSGPGLGYPVQKVVKQNEDLLIDADYVNNDWRKGFAFGDNGQVETLYFSSKLSDEEELSFFTLGYFATTSIVVLCILGILVLIVCIPLLIFGIATSVAGFGLLLLGLLVGILYFTYQIVESMFFELFMINLPY
mgnify:CR=1 FL=1|jgi:hypothetical protein